jgi:hypothetical protein
MAVVGERFSLAPQRGLTARLNLNQGPHALYISTDDEEALDDAKVPARARAPVPRLTKK